MSRTDNITVLQSTGRVLAKTWRTDGTVASVDSAKQFKPDSVAIDGIEAFSALLSKLESDPHRCLIRGEFSGYDDANKSAAKKGEKLQTGFVLRNGDCFKDQPRHWLMIDVDRFEPAISDPLTQPEWAVREFIRGCLPPEFLDASFHWALSARAGHPDNPGILKAHVAFWLSEPRTCAELAAWADTLQAGLIDRALYHPVQMHYTAAPVFEAGVANPVQVRSGFYQSEFGKDVVDLEIDAATLANAHQHRATREPMADPTAKPGLIGAFCRAFKPKDLALLLPEMFEPSRRERRFDWLGHDSKEGVFITDCWRGLVSSHGTAPTGQNRLCNIYDFVRLHLFKPLDQSAHHDCRPGDLPSVLAMRDWIEDNYPHVLKDVRHNTSSPEEDFGHLDADQVQAGVAEQQPHSATRDLPPQSALRVWRPADLRNRPAASWLVQGVLPLRGMASLVGDSNVGKSFCALDVGLAIARGVTWFGKDVKQGAVLYVAAEGGYGFGRRLDAYGVHHTLDVNDLPFGVIDDGIDLRTSQVDATRVIAAAKDFEQVVGQPLRLVVLDTMARMLSGGDENSSTDMGHVLAMAGKISQATGALVLIVHHLGKDHQRGARGHSSFRAALDAQLIVTKLKDRCVIKLDKQRDGPTDLEMAYRLETVELDTVDGDFEAETSAVVVQVEQANGFNVAPAKLGKWQSHALDAVQACAGWGAHGRVKRDAVVNTAEQLLPQQGITLPSTWKKMLDRGLADLIKEGVLDADGAYLAEGFTFPESRDKQFLH